MEKEGEKVDVVGGAVEEEVLLSLCPKREVTVTVLSQALRLSITIAIAIAKAVTSPAPAVKENNNITSPLEPLVHTTTRRYLACVAMATVLTALTFAVCA